jgi:hypothetical protein
VGANEMPIDKDAMRVVASQIRDCLDEILEAE